MENFTLIAKTFQGLEQVLAEELTNLGANDIEIGRRMVSFSGDKKMMYKTNFCLRTAIRVLKPILTFKAKNPDEVYEQIKNNVDWDSLLDLTDSFAVDAVVFSNEFRHSKFVAYRVKDAIADYFSEKYGKRPSVSLSNPDLRVSIHIAEESCTLSLDSSGVSLHRRGYRQEAVEAPLNEVLAAAMIMMTGWKGDTDLIDPMCGSGTIPIEAALIARNIAPGVFRKEFAFERWKNFDSDLFDSIYNDDTQEREFEHKIYAYDNDPKAIEIGTHNIKAAGVSKDVILTLRSLQHFEKPAEKAIIITNPPYGERISTPNLLELYQMIGERLKHSFTGNTAWLLSYRDECFEQIALRHSERIFLNNGSLECQFRKYELFDGRMKEFKGAKGFDDTKDSRGSRDFRKDGDSRPPRSFDRNSDSRGPRSFGGDRDSRGSRDFRKDGDSRGPRSFGGDRDSRGSRDFRKEGDSRPPRSFDRNNDSRGSRSFGGDRDSRGSRDFRKEGDSRPPRSFDRNSDSRGSRSFGGDRDSRGSRDFRKEGGSRPPRSFDHNSDSQTSRGFRKDGAHRRPRIVNNPTEQKENNDKKTNDD